MLIYFRNGTSAWFPLAKGCEEGKGVLIPKTARGRHIAEIYIEHVAFWCYDNEEVTTYGFKEAADAK